MSFANITQEKSLFHKRFSTTKWLEHRKSRPFCMPSVRLLLPGRIRGSVGMASDEQTMVGRVVLKISEQALNLCAHHREIFACGALG